MESTPSIDYTKLDLGSVPFKPETKGESITITVTGARTVKTKEGKAGAVLEGFEADGTVRDWVAWNLRNKAELARVQPQPGDVVRIVYEGTDPDASNPALAARWFHLDIVEPESGADDDIEFDSAA